MSAPNRVPADKGRASVPRRTSSTGWETCARESVSGPVFSASTSFYRLRGRRRRKRQRVENALSRRKESTTPRCEPQPGVGPQFARDREHPFSVPAVPPKQAFLPLPQGTGNRNASRWALMVTPFRRNPQPPGTAELLSTTPCTRPGQLFPYAHISNRAVSQTSPILLSVRLPHPIHYTRPVVMQCYRHIVEIRRIQSGFCYPNLLHD